MEMKDFSLEGKVALVTGASYGIGFAIANNIQAYQFGAAGVAILLVFVFAYCVELTFTTIKKNYI